MKSRNYKNVNAAFLKISYYTVDLINISIQFSHKLRAFSFSLREAPYSCSQAYLTCQHHYCCIGFSRASQKDTFLTCFDTFEIFYLIFLNSSWPQITQPVEANPIDNGEAVLFQKFSRQLLIISCTIFSDGLWDYANFYCKPRSVRVNEALP